MAVFLRGSSWMHVASPTPQAALTAPAALSLSPGSPYFSFQADVGRELPMIFLQHPSQEALAAAAVGVLH